jgi:hypothetical protein
MAGPGNAVGAGVLCDAAGGVDDVELALVGAGVGRDQRGEDLLRRLSRA